MCVSCMYITAPRAVSAYLCLGGGSRDWTHTACTLDSRQEAQMRIAVVSRSAFASGNGASTSARYLRAKLVVPKMGAGMRKCRCVGVDGTAAAEGGGR